MRKQALRWIALAFALASFSSLSDERTERPMLEHVDVFADSPLRAREEPRALDEAKLDALRGGLLSPVPLHEAGVVLWDEPRKTLPPAPRSVGADAPSSSVSGALNIQR